MLLAMPHVHDLNYSDHSIDIIDQHGTKGKNIYSSTESVHPSPRNQTIEWQLALGLSIGTDNLFSLRPKSSAKNTNHHYITITNQHYP